MLKIRCMIIFMVAFILILTVPSCYKQNNVQNSEVVLDHELNGINYINAYYFSYFDSTNVVYLDSALMSFNSALSIVSDSTVMLRLFIRKLNVYNLQHEYDKAISFIDSCMFEPSYSQILKYRFEAFKARDNNDKDYNRYFDKIINILEEYLKENRTAIVQGLESGNITPVDRLKILQYVLYSTIRNNDPTDMHIMLSDMKNKYPASSYDIDYFDSFIDETDLEDRVI